MSFRCRERYREYHRNWQRKQRQLGKIDSFKKAFQVIKHKCTVKNIPFNLSFEELKVPEICPVLGIPIITGKGIDNRNNAPSVDRINPNKGYTKDNVRVISFKANRLKSNMTVEECRLLLNDFEQNCRTPPSLP